MSLSEVSTAELAFILVGGILFLFLFILFLWVSLHLVSIVCLLFLLLHSKQNACSSSSSVHEGIFLRKDKTRSWALCEHFPELPNCDISVPCMYGLKNPTIRIQQPCCQDKNIIVDSLGHKNHTNTSLQEHFSICPPQWAGVRDQFLPVLGFTESPRTKSPK